MYGAAPAIDTAQGELAEPAQRSIPAVDEHDARPEQQERARRAEAQRLKVGDRTQWLYAVAEHTGAHRRWIAARHELRAACGPSSACPDCDAQGRVTCEHPHLNAQGEVVKLPPLLKRPAGCTPLQEMLLQRLEAEQIHLAVTGRYLDDTGERDQQLEKAITPREPTRAHPNVAIKKSNKGKRTPWPVVGEVKHANGSVMHYRWHMSRAKGQREKFDNVMSCGSESLVHRCSACSTDGPRVTMSCGNHRLCLKCRAARVARFRAKFAKAQKRALQELWRDRMNVRRYTTVRGREKPGAPITTIRLDADSPFPDVMHGGPWGEKFLTLTLPHSGSVADDVAELPKAWRKFWRLLRAHVLKDICGLRPLPERDLAKKHLRYCRVIEVTPGEDRLGHAHMHVWLVAPFIHHNVIRHLWGMSMSRTYQRLLVKAERVASVDEIIESLPEGRKQYAPQLRHFLRTRRGIDGRPLALVFAPVVDIQRIDSAGMGAELCKYLIKDGEINKTTGKMERLEPELFSRIYAALENRRCICCSRHLMTEDREGCFCRDCGGVFRRWIENYKPSEPVRGPPGQMELPLDKGNA